MIIQYTIGTCLYIVLKMQSRAKIPFFHRLKKCYKSTFGNASIGLDAFPLTKHS